jgi:hypothetical protein
LDLNYLLHRHQVSLMRADTALCAEARHSHLGLAREYAVRIKRFRTGLGIDSTPLLVG